MATRVYEEEEIQLQNDDEVTVKPLSITRLRKFMEVVQDLEDMQGDEVSQFEGIDIMVKATAVALAEEYKPAQDYLDAEEDDEDAVTAFEDVLDIQTMQRVLEVAGGVTVGPNQMSQQGPIGTT